MDKSTVESYYKYISKELDIYVQESFNLMDEKELDLKFLNLIDYIKNKFDSEDLHLYNKVRIHDTLFRLEDVKIYFNNKLTLCKGKEKVIDYSPFMVFLATGVAILVTMAFILIQGNKNNIIYFITCIIMVLIISGLVVSKFKEKSSNEIRIECGFYELVLNISDEVCM